MIYAPRTIEEGKVIEGVKFLKTVYKNQQIRTSDVFLVKENRQPHNGEIAPDKFLNVLYNEKPYDDETYNRI